MSSRGLDLSESRLNSRKKVRAELSDLREESTDVSIPMGRMQTASRNANGWNKSRTLAFSEHRPAEISVHKADLASGDV
jgi:hypothetical protein